MEMLNRKSDCQPDLLMQMSIILFTGGQRYDAAHTVLPGIRPLPDLV